MDLGLTGKRALVCSSTAGLGLAIAGALADEGARVVISGRRSDVAHKLAQALPGSAAVTCDVTDPGAAETLLRDATATLGGEMDIVVLNGPGPKPGPAAPLSSNEVRAALETLVIFQQDLAARSIIGMRKRGWGRVLAIGSSGVAEPIANLALSNLGRSALAAYLKTLAGEVACDGVTVNMLLPGRIDTDRVRALDRGRAEREGRTVVEVAAQSTATIPAGRYGTTEEFGAVGAFLCSERASYITGSALRCDGGMAHRL